VGEFCGCCFFFKAVPLAFLWTSRNSISGMICDVQETSDSRELLARRGRGHGVTGVSHDMIKSLGT
jgi:hypothetical protein